MNKRVQTFENFLVCKSIVCFFIHFKYFFEKKYSLHILVVFCEIAEYDGGYAFLLKVLRMPAKRDLEYIRTKILEWYQMCFNMLVLIRCLFIGRSLFRKGQF
jgi:hypothetical protein